MICEECLKELNPKDMPYKCFSKGLKVGHKDITYERNARDKAENKLKNIRAEITYIKGFEKDKHFLKIIEILNSDEVEHEQTER